MKKMQFDPSKLKAVVLATSEMCPPDKLGAVKLHKVLYFLDMIHYAQTGSSVTGAAYIKRPFGPPCSQLLRALAEMSKEGQIEISETEFYGLRKKEYLPKVKPEKGVLNDSEIALLKEIVDFVCMKNSAKTISDISHQLPWEMVEFGAEIPYNTALMLFESDVSPEAINIVEEGSCEIEAARSNTNPLDLPKLSAFRRSVLAQSGQI